MCISAETHESSVRGWPSPPSATAWYVHEPLAPGVDASAAGGRRMAAVAMLEQSAFMHWHASCVCTDVPRVLVWGVSKRKRTTADTAG